MPKKDMSSFANQVMSNLMFIHRNIISKGRLNFKGMDQVTFPQIAALTIIDSSEALRMKDIAALLRITLPAATGMIDRLFKTGLVKRVPDEKDRRVIHITLTPQGKSIVKSMHASKKAMFESLFSKLTEKERMDYLAITAKIKNILSKENE